MEMREMGEGKCQVRCMEGEGGFLSMNLWFFHRK